ncbi:hypothetical protein [Maribacter aquimaris]|nr:hypothetical protein [Maribacter aquimaris]
MDFRDLAHMDELIEHAQLHSEKYGDNFLVFLSKHYGELQPEHSKDHQEEKQDHEQLPFNHHCCSHSIVVYMVNNLQVPVINTVPVFNYTTNFFYLDYYSFLEKSDIFQPPKQA